ncbi:Replication protein A 70 kDa DNA-binding subunit B [Orobanche gracilis]
MISINVSGFLHSLGGLRMKEVEVQNGKRAITRAPRQLQEAVRSGYWCEGCQKNEQDFSLRYIMAVKVSDASGEAYLSVFNEQAEKGIGCSADDLNELKSQDGESHYLIKLKEATWVPHLFLVSVTPHEYNNEKRQKITIRVLLLLIMQLNPSF